MGITGFSTSPFLPEPDTTSLGSPLGITAYANEQTDAANAFLLTLAQAATNLAPPVITPEFPTGPSAPGAADHHSATIPGDRLDLA
jgi:hypothetical protein